MKSMSLKANIHESVKSQLDNVQLKNHLVTSILNYPLELQSMERLERNIALNPVQTVENNGLV